jgi:uncharacterized RDD family membrane protein YckC
MASTAPAAVSRKKETVVNFVPAAVKAPFLLRCAALLIDYILLLVFPVLWLLWGRLVSDTSASAAPGGLVWFLSIVLWIVDFILLPLLRGQTVGKMFTGLTIVGSDGLPLSLVRIIKRNVLGYFLTAATLGIGFLAGALNRSGRTLHDVVAGTVVVQGRKRPV